MPQATKTDRNETSRRQVREIFFEQLDGQIINEVDGPNGSLIQFWNIAGRMVLVQIWADAGWDYYLAGQKQRVDNDEIKDDILDYFGLRG